MIYHPLTWFLQIDVFPSIISFILVSLDNFSSTMMSPQVLNQIVYELPPEHPLAETRPLRELLGHTPLQVRLVSSPLEDASFDHCKIWLTVAASAFLASIPGYCRRRAGIPHSCYSILDPHRWNSHLDDRVRIRPTIPPIDSNWQPVCTWNSLFLDVAMICRSHVYCILVNSCWMKCLILPMGVLNVAKFSSTSSAIRLGLDLVVGFFCISREVSEWIRIPPGIRCAVISWSEETNYFQAILCSISQLFFKPVWSPLYLFGDNPPSQYPGEHPFHLVNGIIAHSGGRPPSDVVIRSDHDGPIAGNLAGLPPWGRRLSFLHIYVVVPWLQSPAASSLVFIRRTMRPHGANLEWHSELSSHPERSQRKTVGFLHWSYDEEELELIRRHKIQGGQNALQNKTALSQEGSPQ